MINQQEDKIDCWLNKRKTLIKMNDVVMNERTWKENESDKLLFKIHNSNWYVIYWLMQQSRVDSKQRRCDVASRAAS